MSQSKAAQLSAELEKIQTATAAIDQLVEDAFAEADFNFVDTFKGLRGGNLEESGLIMLMAAKKANENMARLGAVLYVREMEFSKDVGDWRSLATAGKRVGAITLLRNAMPALGLVEARNVVDAFLIKSF